MHWSFNYFFRHYLNNTIKNYLYLTTSFPTWSGIQVAKYGFPLSREWRRGERIREHCQKENIYSIFHPFWSILAILSIQTPEYKDFILQNRSFETILNYTTKEQDERSKEQGKKNHITSKANLQPATCNL